MTILERREDIGIKKGKKEGIEEGKIEIVRELIKMGSETDFIVKASKLSKEQVEEIRKEVESK